MTLPRAKRKPAFIKTTGSVVVVILSTISAISHAQTDSSCQPDTFSGDPGALGNEAGMNYHSYIGVDNAAFVYPNTNTPPSMEQPVAAENVVFFVTTGCFTAQSTTFSVQYTNFDTGSASALTTYTAPSGVATRVAVPGRVGQVFVYVQNNGSCIGSMTSISYTLDDKDAVIAPPENMMYPLTQNDFTSVTVPIGVVTPDRSGASVQTKLQYQTSGGKGVFSQSNTSTVPAGYASIYPDVFSSTGGQLTISYKDNASQSVICGSGRTVYIVGNQIPPAEITAQLQQQYAGGSTPNLLVGLAQIESSSLQFSTRTLFGQSALWPRESFDGGSHIGLLMLAVAQADAWDWKQNITDGASLFSQKLAKARRLEGSIRLLHLLKEPPMLTGVQLENMALVLYGPYASNSLTEQYYTVVVQNGIASWTINTSGNPDGVAYADSVRNATP